MKEYKVQVNGSETTIQLADEDVKNYPGAVEVKAKEAKAPANKARQQTNTK